MKKDMGGLRKYMPQTFITFLIGSLALAGIFPLAGFWSKDEILAAAGTGNYKAFLVVGIVGAFMTAAYMTRCIYLTFFGEYRGGHEPADETAQHVIIDEEVPHGHAGPHESPALITAPLWILSAASIMAGWLQFEPGLHLHYFHDWFQPRVAFPEVAEVGFKYGLAAISVGAALLGFFLAYLFYWKRAFLQDAAVRPGPLHAGKTFLVNKYYLDALYTDGVVATTKGPIAQAAYWVNQNVIDAVLRGAGAISVRAAGFVYGVVDRRGVDAAYNDVAIVTGESGGLLRRWQTGRLQEYALFIVFAVAAVAFVLAWRF